MDADIRDILRTWRWDPERTVRVIQAGDGRMVLQVRQPLGIEQYEMDGRPDGERPHGFETFLDWLESCRAGSPTWAMDMDDFRQLQQEGIMMYSRYVVLYQIHDFARVIRDTSHNLRVCDILEQCFLGDEKYNVLQFKPFIIRMHASARAWDLARKNRVSAALAVIDEAKNILEGLEQVPTPAFAFEKARSLNSLDEARAELVANLASQSPNGEVGMSLEEELDQALENEDYEKAALLRDKLRSRAAWPQA